MKILYDHQMFSLQRYGGITKYFSELMSNISTGHQFDLSLIFSDNHYLVDKYDVFKKINILPSIDFKGKKTLKKLIYDINQSYSQRCVSAGKFDLFHPTFYNDYFLEALKKPYVITVHDLIAFKFKDVFYKSDAIRLQMERVIRNANRVISISENTKKDLIEVFGIDSDKIDVIYHGYNQPDNKRQPNRHGKYILFVGARGNYKNFQNFIRAMSTLLNNEKDLKLICVGGPFTKDETVYLKELKISEQVMVTNVNEVKLNNLYANALVFVYPSLYEGFGMPILEAFSNDCPVCLSNVSSMPEVAGDAGVFFNPHDPDSILSAVKKVIYDKDFALKIIGAGRNRLMNFSWKKTARETMLCYQKAI